MDNQRDELFNFRDIVINESSTAPPEQEEKPTKEENEPPVKEFNQENVNLGEGQGEITNNDGPQQDDPDKPENVSIAHITNYSFKRANYIAKQAREELIFIAFFKGTPKPIPGQKPNLKNMFEYRKFYYWPVLTEDWEEIRNLKNEVARLNEISNQKNGYTDVQGNFHPPSLRENDKQLTGLLKY